MYEHWEPIILVLSQPFRINKYRLRLELVQRNIKTIEHVHLYSLNRDLLKASIFMSISITIKDGENASRIHYLNDSIETFDELLVLTRDGEDEVCVCKFGLGLHKRMSKSALIADNLVFERQHEGKRKQYSVGDEHHGQFNEAEERHGYGVYRWLDKSIYLGQWLNDVCTGEGIYRASNGDIYCGQFVNGLIYGARSRTSFDGHNYVGDYLFRKLHVNGVYYSSSTGTKYVGRWIYGECV